MTVSNFQTKLKPYLPFFILASLFLLLKLSTVGVRLSDTNIYFYTGYQLLQGKILYKDIFFTNFPLLPYVSSLYSLLTLGNLSAFYFTASIEAVATSFLLYLLVLKKIKNVTLATATSATYLFSFLLLATNDHQTGVFLASFFAVLSYYFYEEKKYLLTGICVALALLTKAYFLPILLVYGFFFLRQRRGEGVRFLGGLLLTTLIILLPSLLLAPQDFFRDVFSYSLTRSQGLPKFPIFWFFILHDVLLITLAVFSLGNYKKNLFLALTTGISFLFLLFYQDVYYLYFNLLLPFLCLSLPGFLLFLEEKMNIQKSVSLTGVGILLMINLFIYLPSFSQLQRIDNLSEITQAINEKNPPVLYGINSLTPALAYLTETPLLNYIVDTNPNIFRKGYLDATRLTRAALAQHALLISQGASYPEYGVNEALIDEIFAREDVIKNCQGYKGFPITAEGMTNRINLIAC